MLLVLRSELLKGGVCDEASLYRLPVVIVFCYDRDHVRARRLTSLCLLTDALHVVPKGHSLVKQQNQYEDDFAFHCISQYLLPYLVSAMSPALLLLLRCNGSSR